MSVADIDLKFCWWRDDDGGIRRFEDFPGIGDNDGIAGLKISNDAPCIFLNCCPMHNAVSM